MTNTAAMRRQYSPYMTSAPDDFVEFADYVLEKVEPYSDGTGWFLTFDRCVGIGMPRLTDNQPEPQVGDTYRQYGAAGWGGRAIGQALNGRVVWYRTPTQEEAHNAEQLAKIRQRQLEENIVGLKRCAALYDALPVLLQRRVDRQRAEAKAEGRDRLGEHMELQLLRDAALIVDACRAANVPVPSFREMSVEEQYALVPQLEESGHSGSSFGYTAAIAVALDDGSLELAEDDAAASAG